MAEYDFDLVVVGSGPGGYKAAITAAHLGARVALIEKSLPGGTCLNQGCIPKKSLLYLASLIEDVDSLNGHGILGQVEGDFGQAMKHKDEVVEGIRQNFPVWLRRLGIKLFSGHGHFNDRHHMTISPSTDENKQISFNKAIIATGSRPRQLAIQASDGRHIINSADFMEQQRALPKSILCIGGGAIGCEFAYLLHQFGARVTLVERSQRLLNQSNIPQRASGFLLRKFERLGVEIRLGTEVSDLAIADDGVTVSLSDGQQQLFEQVLVAIGREPNTENLGLEKLGIILDKDGFIPTSDCLESDIRGIYAIGDVKQGPMTANSALHDAKVAATNALQGNKLSRNYHRVPMVIDSALEIATVGLTEDQAENAGFEPDVARGTFGASAKARGRMDVEGFVEVVHDEETGQMLGGCIVGAEAGEQIQMLTAACQSTKGLWFLKEISYSHPSWCEELENAIDPYTAEFIQSGKEIFRPGIYAINE
jgi:dihydrolipoamide dehydrogenase